LTVSYNKADAKIEIKIPLKSFVPCLKDNKTMWGVKTQLKIIFPNDLHDKLYKTNKTVVAANEVLTLNHIELRMPYVKLENQKQLQLWSQMYSNTINKYWIDNDQYWSSSIDNTRETTNDTFRVAVKGLNSRPR